MSHKAIPTIDSVDQLWQVAHRPGEAYVVRGEVVEEVARRWNICTMLAELLHEMEIARAERADKRFNEEAA